MSRGETYATATAMDPEKVAVMRNDDAIVGSDGKKCGRGKYLAMFGVVAAIAIGIVLATGRLGADDSQVESPRTADEPAGVADDSDPIPTPSPTPRPVPTTPTHADVLVTFSNTVADDTPAWRAQLIALVVAETNVPEGQVEIVAVQPGSLIVTFRFHDDPQGSQRAITRAKLLSAQLSSGTGVMATRQFQCCVVHHERQCSSSSPLATLANGANVSGSVLLPPSPPNTLVLLSQSGVPAGRSYESNPWEGVLPSPLVFDCCVVANGDGGACEVELPAGTFDILVITGGATSVEKDVARFLLQATFGPTSTEIATLAGSSPTATRTSMEHWIDSQMALSMTSHREYYRKRTNPRLVAPLSSGGVRTPCLANSRWHRFALTAADVGLDLDVASNAAGGFDLAVAGVLRTKVDSFSLGAGSYVLCDAIEDLGAEVQVGDSVSDCNTESAQVIPGGNPAIDSPDVSRTQAFALADVTFVYDADANGGAVATTQRGAERTEDGMPFGLLRQPLPGCTLPSEGDAFISLDGVSYMHDPRLHFIDNTILQPATEPAGTVCPTVNRNFLNVDGCVRTETCAPTRYASTSITLNDTTLRNFHESGGSYVYKIDGLRLEDSYAVSPCEPETVSRWRRHSGACTEEASLDANTLMTIRTAISSASGNVVRDLELVHSDSSGGSCTADAYGYLVTVGSDCWEHTHPDQLSVYDFSYWVLHHPGNEALLQMGRSNPISIFALSEGVQLNFPASHLMNRWSKHSCAALPCNRHAYIMLVGRAEDEIDFATLPTSVQTPGFAAAIGALIADGNSNVTGTEACGSFGEVANDPSFGNRYHSFLTIDDDFRIKEESDYLRLPYRVQNGKMMVWENIGLTSSDQLRQRMAWALSQIYLLGENGYPKQKEIETWTVFYDIFVRNAFGNLRDILRAVSWSPQMGRYLTFRRSSGFCPFNGCSYPDENYAREFMQLFTIGLWKLNKDGTSQLDENGQRIPTYSNEDVMTFARSWTGFDDQPARGNIEHYVGDNSDNFIDPSMLKPAWRDFLPKMDLNGGYLGDSYPLCADLPDRTWLRKGATFMYLGRSPEPRSGVSAIPGVGASATITRADRVPHIDVVGTSSLFGVLCNRPTPVDNCLYPTSVTLSEHLTCSGNECDVEAPTILRIVDGASLPVYYEYHPAPCVGTAFYENAQQIKGIWKTVMCADPTTPAAGAACCENGSPANDNSLASAVCEFSNERVKFITAQTRCNATSKSMCSRFRQVTPDNNDVVTGHHCDYNRNYAWMNRPCLLQVQIYGNGKVNIIHAADKDSRDQDASYFSGDFMNRIRVGWRNGRFPSVVDDCATAGDADACVVHDDGASCTCNTTVQNSVVFVDSGNIPTPRQIAQQLHIGSPPPDNFDSGTYTLCQSSACQAAQDVEVWLRGNSDFDMNTVFKVVIKDKTLWLLNKRSVVQVGSSFEFRNPPHFMHFHQVTSRDAAYETEALIDHLFYHDNTAAFISHRLIQRFTTSNPSPRYVHTVVRAFETGMYSGQTYSGTYGDLGAALAAILLDREAQSSILDLDPHHGRLREPLLKLMHLMRSMEYRSRHGHEIELYWVQSRIGQSPYQSPTVFNFYLPDYSPVGPVSERLLVAPEAELATAPYIIQSLNGMFSLVHNGLTTCSGGFGSAMIRRECGCVSATDCVRRTTASGELTFNPDSTDPADAVAELDLLLTGGRLNRRNREIIEAHYTAALTDTSIRGTSGSTSDAVRLATQLILGTAEFHSTQANVLSDHVRPEPLEVVSQNRPYKATVVIYLRGGADTFNVLVPHSNCGTKNMYDEYSAVRDVVALPKGQLREISVPINTQPCNSFGLHPDLSYIEELYEDSDASFFANIGNLIEPITAAEYNSNAKRIPMGLFAHNTQVEHSQAVHPQRGDAKGVLGRIVGALSSQHQPYKAMSYSIAGSQKIMEGPITAQIISPTGGAVRLIAFDSNPNGKLGAPLLNMSRIKSSSIFAETWSSLLEASIESTESLGAKLDEANVEEAFDEDKELCLMLKQVAKLISLSQGSGRSMDTERDAFVVNLGGFDTHSDLIEDFSANMQELDSCVASFVRELKRTPGLWENVAIATLSDFGRTITSNGIGTDHGWGGNHMLLGGSVIGGRIHGAYPSSLTEDSAQMLPRGRLIPTTPWEGLWHGVAEWMDVDAEKMAEVLPNMENFVRGETLFTKEQLFV